MNAFRNVFQKVQSVFDVAVSLCLIVMIGVVFLQTFCRFVIFYSLPWSEELSRYLFVAIIVLGANLAITRGMFVRIEIIDNYLRGRAAAGLLILRKLAAVFVNAVFVYGSFRLVQIGGFQTSPAMAIPMEALYALLLAGYSMNVLASMVDLCEYFAMGQAKQEEVK